MKRLINLSVLFILIAVSPLYAGSAPDIQEGNWEITTSVEMPGMPAVMPPTKHTQCITKKNLIPKTSQKDVDCRMINQSTNGNTISWTMECKSAAGTSTSTGKITYNKDSFSGTFITDVPRANMKMTSKMSGKRIGPCK